MLTVVAADVSAAEDCVSATGRAVSVSGMGSITMRPDRVSFSVGVETEAANVADAFRRNGEKVNAVIAALKKHGVTQQELQTSDLAIGSRQDEDGRKLAGFRVSNSISVTREDPSGVGELLQAAIAAGANQAGSLNFFVADRGKLVPRGLELAFQNARLKAETLATLAGRTLGAVVCVNDTSNQYGVSGFMAMNNAANANTYDIAVGRETVSFSVSVVFELQ